MKPVASAQTVLEYCKAFFQLITGLAWPVLIVVLVVFFQKELRGLIARLAELEGFGFKFKTIRELLDETKVELPYAGAARAGLGEKVDSKPEG